MQYGKKYEPGALNAAMMCFGQFRDNFTAGITEAVLFKCTSMEELCGHIRRVNDKLATAAIAAQDLIEEFTPMTELAEVYQGEMDRQMQRKLLASKRKETGRVHVLDFEGPPSYSASEQYAMDEAEFQEEYAEAVLGAVQSSALQSPQPRLPAGRLVDTKIPYHQQAKDQKICYSFYKHGACAFVGKSPGEKCPFNHQKELMIAHAKMRWQELQDCPWSPSAIEKKLISGRPSQDARQLSGGGGPAAKVYDMEMDDELEYDEGSRA